MTWVYDADGNESWVDDSGTGNSDSYIQEYWSTPEFQQDAWLSSIYADPSRALDAVQTPEQANNLLASVRSKLGPGIESQIRGFLFKPNGDLNTSGLATAGLALYGMMGGNKPQYEQAGYTKAIPKLDVTRQQVQYNDPNRRPGEGGRDYFTAPQYTTSGDAIALQNAKTAANTEVQGILSGYKPRAAAVNPYAGKMKTPWETPAASTNTGTNTNTQAASGVAQLMPVPDAATYNPKKTMADGGIANLARGRYLSGSTDGMADKIPTSIDGKDPAALSHGEFVIPADVVSHLGNGNSEAGAEKLYAMMDKVRKARTGTTKQGKRINPDKFMPGGIAGYASGGAVQNFDAGGEVGGALSSSLSPWAGDFVTGMLGKAQAIGNEPYKAYKGPLTAGASDLQNQAFAGAQSIANAGYTPTTYNANMFGAQQAQQYMNPYIQAALNPQLAEMRRQSDITRMHDAAKMTQAGAFGGSRQAIMESEAGRNLLDKQTQAIGTGYQTAYDKAMGQFNADEDRRLGALKDTESSRQYSAKYGLDSLKNLSDLGATQRDIEAEGIAADRKQFEEQRDYPAAMLGFQKKLLESLPLEVQKTTTQATTPIGNVTSSISGAQTAIEALRKLGVPI
jgi:hypothetical protein